MQQTAHRQEVLNVELARLLAQLGVVTEPEVLLHRAMPDVLVVFRGLRLAIEGELADQARADNLAWKKATMRVQKGIAHIGVALVYPASLRRVPFASLSHALATAPLRFSVCLPYSNATSRWQAATVSRMRSAL